MEKIMISLVFLIFVMTLQPYVYGQHEQVVQELQSPNNEIYQKTMEQINATSSQSFEQATDAAVAELSGIINLLKYSVCSERAANEFVQKVWDRHLEAALQAEIAEYEKILQTLTHGLLKNYDIVFSQAQSGKMTAAQLSRIKAQQKKMLLNLTSHSGKIVIKAYLIRKELKVLQEKLLKRKPVSKTIPITKIAPDLACFLLRLPKTIIKKGIAQGATASSLALVDGPLPIGDILAVALDLGISIYTVYELYDAHCQIKQEMRNTLEQSLQERRATNLSEIKATAAEILNTANSELEQLWEEHRQ